MPRYILAEFDGSLQNCINFHDLVTCQTNILNNGIYELKTFAQYYYMHYYSLLCATQVTLVLTF